MTATQQIILQCFVIEPEDKTAFKRAQVNADRRAYVKSHPEQRKETTRKYREKNRVRSAQVQRAYCENNPGRVRESKQKWVKNNPGYWREYLFKRRLTDPEYRLKAYCRTRIYLALKKGKKCARTAVLLGCTIPELRAHLEKQFRPGMTWENYGPVWHVDHRKPCASFDLLDPAQQRVCFHFTNLQPLFAAENIRKGDKIE